MCTSRCLYVHGPCPHASAVCMRVCVCCMCQSISACMWLCKLVRVCSSQPAHLLALAVLLSPQHWQGAGCPHHSLQVPLHDGRHRTAIHGTKESLLTPHNLSAYGAINNFTQLRVEICSDMFHIIFIICIAIQIDVLWAIHETKKYHKSSKVRKS